MFKALSGMFTPAKSERPSKEDSKAMLTAKIKEFADKLQHQILAKNVQLAALQNIVKGKPRSVLKTPACVRLLGGINRHNGMIRVFETSLTALEETLANILVQDVHNQTTWMIGSVVRNMHGVNVDDADDSLGRLDEFREQREELASMMAAATSHNGADYDELAQELDLCFAEESVPEAEGRASNSALVLPAAPTTLLQMPASVETDNNGKGAQGGAELADRMAAAF
jgi:hypothetical protein